LSGRRSNVAIPDGVRRRLIETLRCTRLRPFGSESLVKHERGVRRKLRTRPSPVNLRRAKPKGASGIRRAKHTADARDPWKGQSPETGVWRAGLLLRQRVYRQAKR
jgi:hypothetical protein